MSEKSVRARSARQPADETRRQMLEAAVGFVTEQGLELDFANLNLEEFIRAAGVPRSTVFRIWPDRRAFVADLIGALFQATPEMSEGFDEETFRIVDEVIRSSADMLKEPESRARLLAEAARVGGARNMTAVSISNPWMLQRSILSAARSGAPALDDDAIRASLRAIEERFLARMEQVYTSWAEIFDRRMLPGLTARDIAVCSASVVEGLVERKFLSDDDQVRRIDIAGTGMREWQIGALALYGIFLAFTEQI